MGRVIASNLYFSFFTDEDNNLNKGIKDTIKKVKLIIMIDLEPTIMKI